MGTFLRVKCECGSEQNIFGSPAIEVSCLMCGKPLMRPRGSNGILAGKTKIVKAL